MCISRPAPSRLLPPPLHTQDATPAIEASGKAVVARYEAMAAATLGEVHAVVQVGAAGRRRAGAHWGRGVGCTAPGSPVGVIGDATVPEAAVLVRHVNEVNCVTATLATCTRRDWLSGQGRDCGGTSSSAGVPFTKQLQTLNQD